jgi:CO dehydrogenase maturation factor
MSFTIAITGKGGVGKTTFSALLVDRLVQRGCKPVLAVDADPNSCLDMALGVRVEKSIGTVREEAREIAAKGLSAGISKQDLLTLKIAESLVESNDFDLLAMGRPEGPGCYCYANNVLKQAIAQIAESYPYIVIDNEAGLENLSRRIVRNVDLLVMVADPSLRGMETLGRLHELAREMNIVCSRTAIIVNRLRSDRLPESLAAIQAQVGTDLVLGLPDDETLAAHAEAGTPVNRLPADHPIHLRIDSLLGRIGL